MEIAPKCIVALSLYLLTGAVASPQVKPAAAKKTDTTKSSTPADSPSSGSALWVRNQENKCAAPNGKIIILALIKDNESKTQPYHVSLGQEDTPTYYAGEPLSIEVVANEDQISEIPMINFAIDMQKADPINIAPLRPSASTTSAAGAKKPEYFCLEWPQKLIGDTIPKLSLTSIYKPSTPDPADPEPTINLGTISFPQVHTLYHYNVATGVIVSSLRNPSFTRTQSVLAGNGAPAQYQTTTDNGNVYAAPVLFFSAYLFGAMDSERDWHWLDLKPEPALGFSLSSPADNFFFGGSSEIRRNVQIVYGYHLGKVTKLSPVIVDDPSSSAAPVTIQRFKGGAYIGLTFNIDFIKGLFTGK
jgi:hypothetical protein